MHQIGRPSEPGVYDLNLLEGEEILNISFSNVETDSFNILTTSGKLFAICIGKDGTLVAAILDISDIAGQLPN